MTQLQNSILLIDDEPQIRKFLRISLNAQGYRVLEAGTGEEGLAQAALNRPDLVVLDLGLPDRDGQDILRDLREWSQVPVLVLSVRASEGEKVLALDGGANDYVTNRSASRSSSPACASCCARRRRAKARRRRWRSARCRWTSPIAGSPWRVRKWR